MAESNAYFTIAGSFDPAELTSLLGIAPTRTRRQGDLVNPRSDPQNLNVPRVKEDYWSLKTADVTSDETERLVHDLLDRLAGKEEDIATFVREHGLYAVLRVTVYIKRDGYAPQLGLRNDAVRQLAALGADFDIDFCIYGDEAE